MLSKNRIKYIQSLSHKKYRDLHRCFIAETPKVINEFLFSNYKVKSIVALPEWIADNASKINNEIETIEVTSKELQKVSLMKTAHQAMAVIEMKDAKLPADLAGSWHIALDDLQDPGNMGTIIRIADWFGIKNIFCSAGTVSAYNPKVVQASMGSLARVNIHEVELEDFIDNIKIPVITTILDGQSIYELDAKMEKGLVVIGNEGNGIRPSILSKATLGITIPRIGKAESLNAAVSTGIIISHLLNKD